MSEKNLPRIESWYRLCPMPYGMCNPGPCKCRDGAKIGEDSVPGYIRRMKALGHVLKRRDVRRMLKSGRRP